jgi:hypothetical protein
MGLARHLGELMFGPDYTNGLDWTIETHYGLHPRYNQRRDIRIPAQRLDSLLF